MTLAFSTHIDKKPTYFVEKIWLGIEKPKVPLEIRNIWITNYYRLYGQPKGILKPDGHAKVEHAKLHTIREDKSDRWKAGNQIHPIVGNRSKKRYQFAPTMECISTQLIEIYPDKYFNSGQVFIQNPDGSVFWQMSDLQIEELALNDGFDNAEQFFKWFGKKEFKGKIIHWTNKTYKYEV